MATDIFKTIKFKIEELDDMYVLYAYTGYKWSNSAYSMHYYVSDKIKMPYLGFCKFMNEQGAKSVRVQMEGMPFTAEIFTFETQEQGEEFIERVVIPLQVTSALL